LDAQFLFTYPDEKRVDISLSNIYGIGKVSAKRICHQLEIHPQCRLKDLDGMLEVAI
jgi:ribosomal protein S13